MYLEPGDQHQTTHQVSFKNSNLNFGEAFGRAGGEQPEQQQ
jgi:hypothetical protein